ncbi:hypothetical protein, partial [Catenuloplanes japonicus]|uniref:hypothetical protein n=1 Tax=Catenuloplanes japonicus TaxID=33876 RepID=UPI001E585828
MRARWRPFTLSGADQPRFLPSGVRDGDGPGLVAFENLSLNPPTPKTPAPTRAPSPQPEVPGAFPDGAEPGDVEAGRP